MAQGGLNQVDRRAPVKSMERMGMAQRVRGNRSLFASPGKAALFSKEF
jgi:hypothetical protein